MFTCYDDRYFYWRLDYTNANPQKPVPRTAQGKVYAQVLIKYDAEHLLSCGMNASRDGSSSGKYLSIWNIPDSKGTGIESNTFNVVSSSTMLAGRIPLSVVRKYWTGPGEVWGDSGGILTGGSKSYTKTTPVFVLPPP